MTINHIVSIDHGSCVCWFINPKKLAGYNYHKPARYWSYLHQVSYRKPGPRIASWAQPEASII